MTDENITQICEIISKLNKSEEVKEFFSELFTESEIKDVVQRWNILKMLGKNESQRNISKALAVSLCKVTRGAKILKNDKSITRKILFDESWRK
jgi:TrpR family trp operon transcriptional repressor